MRMISSMLVLMACGQSESIENQAGIGQPVAAEVTELANGSLYADRLLTRIRGGDSDEAVPLEEAPQAILDEVEARWPGATLLAGEREPGEWGVEFLTADGEHLEAEFDGDGNFIEVEAADGEDDDDDGEDDVLAQARRSFVSGPPERDGEGYRLLGVRVTGAAELDAAVRVRGRFTGSALEAVEVGGADVVGLGGLSEGITKTAGGYELRLLGRTITIDEHTEVVSVDSPLGD